MEAGAKVLTAGQRMLRGPEMANADDPSKVHEYSTMQILDAGIRQESSVWSYLEAQNYKTNAMPVAGYDPMPDVPDHLLMYTDEFRDVTSPEMMDQRVSQLNAEAKRRKILTHGGAAAFWGQALGSMASPEYWPLMIYAPFTGAGGVTRTALALGGVAFTEAATHEAIMHSNQSQRTLYESLMNVGVSTMIGTAVGATIGKAGYNRAADAVRDKLDDISNNDGIIKDQAQGTFNLKAGAGGVGAAATTLGVAERVRYPSVLSSKWIGVGRPLENSPSPMAVNAFNRLAGTDKQLQYNALKVIDPVTGKPTGEIKNIATVMPVQRESDRVIGSYSIVSRDLMQTAYKKRIDYEGRFADITRLKPSNRNAYHELNKDIAMELDYPGSSSDPIVLEAANRWRSEIGAPVEKIGRDSGLLGDDAQVKYADGFFKRAYNRLALRGDQDNAKKLFRYWFKQERAEKQLAAGKAKRAEKIAGYKTRQEAAEQKFAKAETRLITKIKKTVDQAELTKLNNQLKKLRSSIAQTTKGLTGKIAKTETEMAGLTEARYHQKIEEGGPEGELSDIFSDVEDSYDKIVSGEMGVGVYTGSHGTSIKERKIPVPNKILRQHGYLQDDIHDLTNAYVNEVVRPSQIIDEFGDAEMAATLEAIQTQYTLMKNAAINAGDPQLANSLQNSMKTDMDSIRMMRDLNYNRPMGGWVGESADQLKNLGAATLNVNTMLYMGMVTLTSLADPARTNLGTIFAPEIGKLGPTILDGFKTLKLNQAQFQKNGIAHETATMLRTARMMDSIGYMDTGSKMVNVTSRGSQGLIRTTGLGPFTDYWKKLAAARTQNDMIQKIQNYSKLSAKNKTIMAQRGVDQQLVDDVLSEIDAGNVKFHSTFFGKGKATEINYDAWKNQDAAKRMLQNIFRQSERALGTPGIADMPAGSKTMAGKIIFQFKSFSFAAHNQFSRPIIEGMRAGDAKVYQVLGQMVAMGVMTHVIRMGFQGRLDELEDYSAMDWTLKGLDYSGAVPLMMMGFNGIDLISGNFLTDMMGAKPLATASDRAFINVLGPTVGTTQNLWRVLSAFSDGEFDERDARAVRRLMPFNNLAWTNRMVTALEKSIVEGLDLKRSGRKTSGGKF